MEDTNLANLCELAVELERKRALVIVETVQLLSIGGIGAIMPTPFQHGYQTACEEILHRLKTEEWTGSLPLKGDE